MKNEAKEKKMEQGKREGRSVIHTQINTKNNHP